MKLLLGSGGFRTAERVAFLVEQMRDFFGAMDRILFVPYALADHDGYLTMLTERGLHAGYGLDGIHRHENPVAAVESAQAIYIGGGNSFRLLAGLYDRGLIHVIRRRVLEGLPYMGVSAGSNVACPTIQTTNDMPIVLPPSFDALNLVPFQINPHYFEGSSHVKLDDGSYQPHFGETRDDRIREYHQMNDRPVVGLWEGGVIRVHDANVTLHGAAARIFRKGCQPRDVPAGTDLSDLSES